MVENQRTQQQRVPWNKGKLIGQKAPLKLKEIRVIRIRLQLARKARDLAPLIWASIVSCAAVIWLAYGCATAHKAAA